MKLLARVEEYVKTKKMPEARRKEFEVLIIRQKLLLEKVRILIEKMEARSL